MKEIANVLEWHRHQIYLNKKFRNERKEANLLGTFYGIIIVLIVFALDIAMVSIRGI